MPVPESLSFSIATRSQIRRIGRARGVLTLAALVFASAGALSMVAARSYYLGRATYSFLIWNLLLAWIPMGCAFVTYRLHLRGRRPNFLFAVCALAWFFFFPNAPYIVTDFVHLRHQPPVPLWFDLLTIASFAWTGLCLGYLSLYLMQEVVRVQLGRWTSWVFVTAMLALGSAGIYAGRFLRWNSWDVLSDPAGIVRGSLKIVEDTGGQLGVAAFISVAFLFLLTTYCATFALTHLHDETA